MGSSIERISGAKGSNLVTGTSAVTRDFDTFIVNEAAVVSEIYYADAPTTNVVSDLGLSGKTLAAGMPWFCRTDKFFSKIKLASGSVITQ